MKHHVVALVGAIITSLFVLLADFAVCWWALTRTFDPQIHDIVVFVLGNFNAMAVAVVTYWVGSSSGSLVKSMTADGATEVRQGPK